MERSTSLSVALRLLALAWAVLVALLAIPLLLVATTWTGRGFALAALCIGFAPILGVNAWESERRSRGALALILVLGWLAMAAGLFWWSPAGGIVSDARVRHLAFNGGAQFRRGALGNLLPELDQLRLGFTIMPLADPLFTLAQSAELKSWTTAIYSELEGDEQFRALGSVMPLTYDELLGEARIGHAYLYVPSRLDRAKPAPVIVFFHGSGGNFKAYLWLLSKVADRCGAVVIAPSFGLGNWREETTLQCYDSALAEAGRVMAIDRANVHVMGLSNGGLAVSQLAGTRGSRFRSLVFLSPVFDRRQLRTYSFPLECKDRHVLVLTGQRDDRVPIDYVEETAAEMKRAGAAVTFQSVEKADHFLLFSHREQVTLRLSEWFAANGLAPIAAP